MSERIKIGIIIGSIRPNRFAEKATNFISEIAKKNQDIDTEILDLKEIKLPEFDSAVSPGYVQDGNYGKPEYNSWAQKIASFDAFIFVAPEYNRGYSSTLKNAIDCIYSEWNNKAVGFVSYGSVGGGRVVEQLRLVAVELQMAPIRNAVHIMSPWNLVDESGNLKDGALNDYIHAGENMLNQLIWWAKALKNARNS
jgi:NAD(P)H-dependent FMN reductase